MADTSLTTEMLKNKLKRLDQQMDGGEVTAITSGGLTPVEAEWLDECAEIRSKYKLEYHEQAELDLFPSRSVVHVSEKDIYRYVEEEGYYQSIKREEFKKEISDWCEEVEFPELDKDGKETGKLVRPLNNPQSKGFIWAHFVGKCAVAPDAFNPPGHVNTTEGVIVVDVVDSKVTVEMKPHSRDYLLLSPPAFTYDEGADTTAALDLLTCLDEEDRQVFLQAGGATLNPKRVLECGLRLPVVLAIGDAGVNGKDATVSTIEQIHGDQGKANLTLQDYKDHQDATGRGRFSMAALANSRLNYASENKQYHRLDQLQTLKAVASGDPILIERKNQDAYSITPACVNIFSMNKPPQLDSMEPWLTSRMRVISFLKTYTNNPDEAEGSFTFLGNSAYARNSPTRRETLLPGCST